VPTSATTFDVMALHRLDHYNIDTAVPEETVAFYTQVLGLTNAPERRPAVDQPGTWILVGDHPAIHVNFVDVGKPGPTGSIDHIAFEGSGYDEMRDHLTAMGASYEAVESPQFNLKQIYVVDPNGVRIEINIRNE
jgi:catechol 2,3-dioxygenase-like lactoylglutathione lyase family enzyme